MSTGTARRGLRTFERMVAPVSKPSIDILPLGGSEVGADLRVFWRRYEKHRHEP